MKTFTQQGPSLGNQYLEDTLLRNLVHAIIPESLQPEVIRDLERFGQVVIGRVHLLANEAETNVPQLVQYDAWNNRVDRVWTCQEWKTLTKTIPAREGLVSIGYNRAKYGQFARFYQL